MLKKLFFVSAIFAVILLQSCDKDCNCPTATNPIVDDDGFTQAIKNFVPDSLLSKMRVNGMRIYTGDNPPDMQFSFLATPFVLTGSNIQIDSIGTVYNDQYFKFYDQDNKNLTLKCYLKDGTTTGVGVESYIVGYNNMFTIFLKCLSTDAKGVSLVTTQVYSGEMTDGGIKGLQIALFMIDDKGDPNDEYIEIGQGRVFYDSDGFSEKIADIQTVGIINPKAAFNINGLIGLPSTSSK